MDIDILYLYKTYIQHLHTAKKLLIYAISIMNEGRLKHVFAQSSWTRKLTLISNDAAKRNLDTYKWSVGREQLRLEAKDRRQSLPFKMSLLNLRSYQECVHRRLMEGEKTVLYNDVRGDIDGVIQENHPRVRRQKKTKQLLKEGLEEGRLIGQEQVVERMHTIFCDDTNPERKYNKYQPRGGRSQLYLPPITVRTPAEKLKMRRPVINVW